MIWIPGSINLADPGTKSDSNLTQSLQLLLVGGAVPIDYKDTVIQYSDKFTG